MVSISPAAATVRLRPGDAFALTGGNDIRNGTVLALDRGVVFFADTQSGRTLMADLAHWDSVELPLPLRAAS